MRRVRCSARRDRVAHYPRPLRVAPEWNAGRRGRGSLRSHAPRCTELSSMAESTKPAAAAKMSILNLFFQMLTNAQRYKPAPCLASSPFSLIFACFKCSQNAQNKNPKSTSPQPNLQDFTHTGNGLKMDYLTTPSRPKPLHDGIC